MEKMTDKIKQEIFLELERVHTSLIGILDKYKDYGLGVIRANRTIEIDGDWEYGFSCVTAESRDVVISSKKKIGETYLNHKKKQPQK